MIWENRTGAHKRGLKPFSEKIGGKLSVPKNRNRIWNRCVFKSQSTKSQVLPQKSQKNRQKIAEEIAEKSLATFWAARKKEKSQRFCVFKSQRFRDAKGGNWPSKNGPFWEGRSGPIPPHPTATWKSRNCLKGPFLAQFAPFGPSPRLQSYQLDFPDWFLASASFFFGVLEGGVRKGQENPFYFLLFRFLEGNELGPQPFS